MEIQDHIFYWLKIVLSLPFFLSFFLLYLNLSIGIELLSLAVIGLELFLEGILDYTYDSGSCWCFCCCCLEQEKCVDCLCAKANCYKCYKPRCRCLLVFGRVIVTLVLKGLLAVFLYVLSPELSTTIVLAAMLILYQFYAAAFLIYFFFLQWCIVWEGFAKTEKAQMLICSLFIGGFFVSGGYVDLQSGEESSPGLFVVALRYVVTSVASLVILCVPRLQDKENAILSFIGAGCSLAGIWQVIFYQGLVLGTIIFLGIAAAIEIVLGVFMLLTYWCCKKCKEGKVEPEPEKPKDDQNPDKKEENGNEKDSGENAENGTGDTTENEPVQESEKEINEGLEKKPTTIDSAEKDTSSEKPETENTKRESAKESVISIEEHVRV